MDENTLHEAVENISLIKGVMDRTSKSFVAFSRIFIYWGMLFIVNSIISLIMIANEDKMLEMMNKYPQFTLIFPIGIVALLAVLIYRHISKKIPLIGFEKHLMKLWILILIMNIIPSQVTIIPYDSKAIDISKLVIKSNNFSVMLFSLAIALIVTALFTDYKHLMNLGIIYIGISLIYAYLRLPIFDEALMQVLSVLPLPFTFLYTGFFLKSKQTRGH